MKIAYITAQTPWGPGEAFILPEVLELKRQGHHVVVFPLRPGKVLAKGSEAEEVARQSVPIPLFSLGVFLKALGIALRCPRLVLCLLWVILRHSGSPRKALKNLVVLPKSLVLGEEIRHGGFEHIHAHWASTPSTAAFLVAEITKIPWSFTAHRWDIKERNALPLKIKSAVFARAISQKGASLLRDEVSKDEQGKVLCIHMGCRIGCKSDVALNDIRRSNEKQAGLPLIVCPANLLPVKGHEVLIKACSLLRSWGIRFRCVMFGQGPLERKLKSMTEQEKLDEFIDWRGQIPHDELLELYGTGKVSMVVLPSIVTAEGEEEGIPVSLIEAMSAGIPVISTLTGSIPELLRDGAGLLVPEKDVNALALAIRSLLEDRALYKRTAESGRKRVVEEFSVERSVQSLLAAIGTPLSQVSSEED